jgi:hypothetical protein
MSDKLLRFWRTVTGHKEYRFTLYEKSDSTGIYLVIESGFRGVPPEEKVRLSPVALAALSDLLTEEHLA